MSATHRVRTDPANPGEFFACCGLLELADRLARGVEGCWQDQFFVLSAPGGETDGCPPVDAVVDALGKAPLVQIDSEDDYSSPILVGGPFQLRVDWWQRGPAAEKGLKVWAGSMRPLRIASAMQHALPASGEPHDLFLQSMVVYEPDQPHTKVEPFYFDARRGHYAHPLDLGFSPNVHDMESLARPAVELLALIGLQRCRPSPGRAPRTFRYRTWSSPIAPVVAALCTSQTIRGVTASTYEFRVEFRTDQKKHKGFASASVTGGGYDK